MEMLLTLPRPSEISEKNWSTYTLLMAEILSGKNARAWVSMDFT